MPATAYERLNASVYRHRIMWTDLAARVAQNEGITTDHAANLVAPLITKEGCPMSVAVALIDLITEK